MALVALMTFTATAICEAGSFERATKLYSPSPRQLELWVVHGVVVPTVNRGSKDSDGVIVVEFERFCTTMVLTRFSVPPFFAPYGPYTVSAPTVMPFVEYATG